VVLAPARRVEGRVVSRGGPVAGAYVDYWSDKPLATIAAFLGFPETAFSTDVLSLLPPGWQRTQTDSTGRFAFADWPDIENTHWIEVRATLDYNPSP